MLLLVLPTSVAIALLPLCATVWLLKEIIDLLTRELSITVNVA